MKSLAIPLTFPAREAKVVCARLKVKIGDMVEICAGKRHARFMSNVGIIRKQFPLPKAKGFFSR